MFSLFRILQRSGGFLAIFIALLGLAFYGIALLSVALVDDPARALRILAVFAAFSAVFGALVVWAVRRALARARRPLNSAYEATTKLASLGGEGGRNAFRLLRRKTAAVGSFVASAARRAARAVSGAGRFVLRVGSLGSRKEPKSSTSHANVIPLRRTKDPRKSGMR